MRTPRVIVAVLMLLVLATVAAPAWAVGPLDGAYALTLTSKGEDPFPLYLIVVQNGSQVGLIFLDEYSTWLYGTGSLNAQQQVTSVIFYIDGFQEGTCVLTFGASVTGGCILFEIPWAVTGSKIF